MDVYDELKIYFDKYIKNYLPYKNNRVFQAFASVLRNYILKDSYKEIPYDLSYLVEKQKITTALYDKLLIGNGYPYDLVRTLILKDKSILLNYLMHYQNDQGDLRHFKQIIELFNENFNVYELYADYRILDTVGKQELDYIMAGKPIYKCNDEPDPIYDYDEIYNATPTYFLSRQQLDYWRLTKSLVLPFKTNLVSLEWQNVTDFNYADSIIALNVYSYFQYQKITTSIDDQAYILSIGDLYQLYNYLIFYVARGTYQNGTTFENITIDIRNAPVFPLDEYAPNNLDHFIELSQQIKNGEQFQDFYKNYISINYRRYLTGHMLNVNDMRVKLMHRLSLTLISYFEKVIDTEVDKLTGLYNAILILENILDEFIELSIDPNAKKYEKWLKLYLSKPCINAKRTTTYKLLYQFKPYHTQFILRSIYKLIYKDDNCWIRDDEFYVNHNYEHSAVVLSDYYTLQIYKYRGEYCLTQNENTALIPEEKMAGLKIGDVVDFADTTQTPWVYSSVRQIINIENQNATITPQQYDRLLNLFEGNIYKQNSITTVYETTPKIEDDFLLLLYKENDVNLLKFEKQLESVFNLFLSNITNDFDYDLFIHLGTIQLKINSLSIPNNTKYELIKNLNSELFHLVDYGVLYNTINKFKKELKNIFNDINIQIALLPVYYKYPEEYYDLNSVNKIIEDSALPDYLKFKFTTLQLEWSFPSNGDSTIQSFLNYIKLVFNKKVKLGMGNITLYNEQPFDISIDQTSNEITLTFPSPINKGVGKLKLQPIQNYIISPQFNNNLLSLNFNKNVQLGEGEIQLNPHLIYITKKRVLTEYAEFISEFDTLINCLEIACGETQLVENNQVLFEKFEEELDNKLISYINDSRYLENFYRYWKEYHHLPEPNAPLYSVVNYEMLYNSYIMTRETLLFTPADLEQIESILKEDNVYLITMDRPWTRETKCFDTLILVTLPPVLETLTIPDALFTFNSIESAKYVHTNEIGFRSIYIGDYIWVVQDTRKYAVKVVGKDLNALNLKIEYYYKGTAGTFYSVGRYRSGF